MDQWTEPVTGGTSACTDGGGCHESGKKKKIKTSVWTTEKKVYHQALRPLGAPKNPRWEKRQPEKDVISARRRRTMYALLNRQTETALDTLAILYV